MAELFMSLTVVILVATAVGFLAKFLKQPLIIGYILSGIIVGPLFLNLVSSNEIITTFAQLGIALLLFMVGLNLNPKVIKDVGKVSLITGIGQVLFTSIIGYFLGIMLGFSKTTSIYIAVALTFSSTIIIMKLLSDRKDLETLYGRIAIGFLIVQDLIVIVILMVISSLGNEGNGVGFFVSTFLKGALVLLALYFISSKVLPKITNLVAKSQEFLLLFSIAWCFAISSLFHFLNFSIEAGALLAGISLSVSPYHQEIGAKMRILRDFFIVLFFILLGAQLSFGNFTEFLVPIIVLSLFILIGNPLIVMVLIGIMKYTKRNSFMAGLTVAQISEFSLVLISLGVARGHLDQDILSLVTFVGLATIAGSSYMIIYADKLYNIIAKYISIFEVKGKKIDDDKFHKNVDYHAILLGHEKIGYNILKALQKSSKKVLVIDFNPDIIKKLVEEKIDCIYGDIKDIEVLDDIDTSNLNLFVSTVPDLETNFYVLKKIKDLNPKTSIIVNALEIEDALKLYDAGADYVIVPDVLGGEKAASLIGDTGNAKRLISKRISHIVDLKRIRES